MPSAFRNVQCNVQQTDPAAQSAAHVREVAQQSDLIGWNELGTLALRQQVRTMPGFTSLVPAGDAGSVAVSWRHARFEYLNSHVEKVHGSVAHITPSRYIVTVQLRERATGRIFSRINTHVVHHIEVGGRARKSDAIKGQTARAYLHFKMLRDSISRAAKLGPVLVGGDFNVDYLAEKRLQPAQREPRFPLSMLSPVAKVVMGSFGTHGSRAIDWTLIAGTIKIVSQRALPHGSSDHNPVQTVAELTGLIPLRDPDAHTAAAEA